MVQELIRAGAALDVQNNNGETALQTARKYNLPEIATLLREAGARCPGYERSGWFISTCKWCGGIEAGRWHDDNGEREGSVGSVNEVNERVQEGKAREGEKEGERKDEDPPPPPFSPAPRTTATREALIKIFMYGGSGDVDEARGLVARGIDIDELERSRNWTVLMCAAVSNRLEIAQELIRAGAALDLQDKDGTTALQYARKWGRTEMATLLREAGARCPGYERSGWFNSTCKRCWGGKAGRWHDEA
jgi:hypothetical protein